MTVWNAVGGVSDHVRFPMHVCGTMWVNLEGPAWGYLINTSESSFGKRREIDTHVYACPISRLSTLTWYIAQHSNSSSKSWTIPLDEYIPQVVLELIACMKHLGYVTFCPSSVLFMFCV